MVTIQQVETHLLAWLGTCTASMAGFSSLKSYL